jgi:hypothetical protein
MAAASDPNPAADRGALVVFRGPHDRYEKRSERDWGDLPVCSVPPVRWPKLTKMGTQYSFAEEREMVRDRLRAALKICVYNGYSRVVIGDFGLGNGYRNPPHEMALIWHEILLYDPEIALRFTDVLFVFEDASQSTSQLILDDISKKDAKKHGGQAKLKNKGPSAGTDMQIFQAVFQHGGLAQMAPRQDRDPKYAISHLMTPMSA